MQKFTFFIEIMKRSTPMIGPMDIVNIITFAAFISHLICWQAIAT